MNNIMESKNIIAVLDQALRVGAILAIADGIVETEIMYPEEEARMTAFLDHLETAKLSLRRESQDPLSGDISFGLDEVGPESSGYLEGIENELKNRGFVARIVPAALKEVLLLVNQDQVSREEREVFWAEISSVDEKEAELWRDLVRNRKDWKSES